ncbi:MAG: hypothetical protein KDC18_08360 [Alphaproteobacteria bacterium]|nr:hypothetical protein [Alphaproteobacteria bacterium]MCB9929756.1 hypothetical protein [Alphaproteobacteria bacterium]
MIPGAAAGQSLDEMRRMLLQQQQMIEQMQRQQQQLQQKFDETLTKYNQLQAKTDQVAKATEAASTQSKTVTNGNERVKIALSGHINRMVTVANDGEATDFYNVDNNNSSSRVRVVGTAKVDDKMSFGTVLEVALQSNSSGKVSQNDQDLGSFTFEGRKVEAYFQHDDYGRLTIGQGSTASDNTAEVDLSGTSVIQYAFLEGQAGGLQFYDKKSGAYGPSIGTVFDDFDGNSRTSRLRYDTPRFGDKTASIGFAGDVASDRRWSVASTGRLDLDDVRAEAAVAFSERHSGTDAQRLDGSVSVLHKPTGLSLTVSSGQDFRDGSNSDDAWGVYGKLGWMARDLVSIGPTAFSLDYAYNENVNPQAGTDSEAQSAGFAVVQNWAEYGVEFYAGYRWHTLDETNADYEDIHVVSVGTRVKF